MSAPPAKSAAGGGKMRVVDVWAHNEEEELYLLRAFVRAFPIAALATSQQQEDAAAAVPSSPPPDNMESSYQAVIASVDRVRSAQLALALLNIDGELALGGRIWRFHFHSGAGAGADPYRVCQALYSCSRAAVPQGTWVTMDGARDLAYVVRHLNGGALPPDRHRFLHLCNVFFPNLYDLKVLAEWSTAEDMEPPLFDAGAPSSLFARFLALARKRQLDLMVGYNAFLSGLGAADDPRLVTYKRWRAELLERKRRVREMLRQNGHDE
ncbi:hypothetical protein BRADI_2g14640v3, partial [Brachypodium distachyon]